MYTIDMNPAQSFEFQGEARIRAQEKGLSDLSDKELEILVLEGRGKWSEWDGDQACSWMNIAYQPDEVYRGLAACRVLEEKHGRDYIKDLIKRID